MFTEQEYSDIAVIATESTGLLYKLRDNNEVYKRYFEEINDIEENYKKLKFIYISCLYCKNKKAQILLSAFLTFY